MIEVRDKITSKFKDKLQNEMDKLFLTLTGRKNKVYNSDYKGNKKWTKQPFKKK